MLNNSEDKAAIILVVEDEDPNMLIFREALKLQKIDNEPEHVKTTQEAVLRLNDTTQALPDIVFIDRNLRGSDQDGDWLAAYIRGDSKFKDISVIVMSVEKPKVEDQVKLANILGPKDYLFEKTSHIKDDIKSLIYILTDIADYWLRIIRKQKKFG